MTLAELFVRISGDNSELKTALSDSESSLNQFGGVALAWGTKLVASLGLFELGKSAMDAAEKFEAADVRIARATGTTGETLSGLQESLRNVYEKTPASLDAVATAMDMIYQRTGQTGEGLETLTQKMLALTRVAGEDIAAIGPVVTRVFGDWTIGAQDQGSAMDYLRGIAQLTGTTIGRLGEQIVYAGAPLRTLGMDFQTAAALIGKFEKEGVNTEIVLGGMKAAIGHFQKGGQDAATAWSDFVEGVKTGTVDSAQVIETVGIKRYNDLQRAIIEGRFEVEKMVTAAQNLANQGGSSVGTLKSEWEKLKHAVELALEPIGAPVLSALTQALSGVAGTVRDGEKAWRDHATAISAVGTVFVEVATWAAIIGGVATALYGLSAAYVAVTASAGLFTAANVSAMLTALGTTIGEVSSALMLKLNMSIMTNTTALAAMSSAVGVAAAAFIGWQIGKWAYDNIPGVNKLGDAIGDLIAKIPLLGGVITKQGALASANDTLSTSTQKLSNFLKDHGVVVDKGNLSTDEWAKKVAEAARQYNALHPPLQKAHTETESGTGKITANTKAHTDGGAATGKHAAELDNYVSKARQFTAEEANRLAKLIAAQEKVDAAERSMELLNQQLSNGTGVWGDLMHALDDFTVSATAVVPGVNKMEQALAAANTTAIAAKAAADSLGGAYTTLKITKTKDLENAATAAAAAYQTIVDSGVATQDEIEQAWAAMTQAEVDYRVAIGADASQLEKELAKHQAKHDSLKTGVVTVWGQMEQQIQDIITNKLSKDLTDVVMGEKDIGTAFEDVGKAIVKTILDTIIEQGLKQLMKWLGDVLSSLGGIGSALGGILGSAGGGAAGGAASAGGTAAGGAASGAGGAGGAVAGGVMGTIGAVGSVVGAVSGIIGNFQNAKMETSLNAIEVNTRFTEQYLGGRADGGVVGILFKIDEEIAWGAGTKATESLRDRFKDWSGPAMGNLDAIKSSLWDLTAAVKAGFQDLATKASQAVAQVSISITSSQPAEDIVAELKKLGIRPA